MGKHEKTLEAVFQEPTPANLKWSAVENMLINLGAELSEGNGSRVRVRLNGRRATFHRPHPQPEASRGQVRAVRMFLENAGIEP